MCQAKWVALRIPRKTHQRQFSLSGARILVRNTGTDIFLQILKYDECAKCCEGVLATTCCVCVTGEPNLVLEQEKPSLRRGFLGRDVKYKQKLFNEEYTRKC